jgi:hypothetical protein
VVREGDTPLVQDLAGLERRREGYFELKKDVQVKGLKHGLNTLRVLAASEASEKASAPLLVNYVPRPALLVIDDLLPIDGGPPLIAQPGPRIAFAPVPKGQVRLRGRIVWDRAEDAPPARPQVVAYVNGFRQGPQRPPPTAASSRERPFEVDLLLNEEKDNQVVVTVPNLPLTDRDPFAEFSVDCQEPFKRERLHLVVVSPQANDALALRKQLDTAFGIFEKEGQRQTRVFEKVANYLPLTGDQADFRHVDEALLRIRVGVNQLAQIRESNDLVVFYFLGREQLNARSHYFLTGPELSPEESENRGIQADYLAKLFSDTAGAHILLLDVDRPVGEDKGNRDKVAEWKVNYPRALHNVSVVRYAWLGRPDVPPNARLMRSLEAGMAREASMAKVTWLDVTNEVRRVAEKPDYKKILKYDQFVADDMRTITVGR